MQTLNHLRTSPTLRIPRPYQREGIADIWRTWTTHDVIMFALATGGGKTFTFTEVIRMALLQGLKITLVAHREELITQAWDTLRDAGIDAGIIQANRPTDYSLPVQVCSIQTISARKQLPHTDLFIIDEAHHVTDDNSYSRMLAMYPAAKVLMVTATPYRLSGDGFMHIVPGKETQLIVNRTLKELIEDGWLVPIRYLVGFVPDLSQVGVGADGDYEKVGTAKVMQMADLVGNYMRYCQGMQGIVFCVNQDHARNVARQYCDAGVYAAYVGDDTSKDDRREIIRLYKAGIIRVITNVAIFTEGTDLPYCQFIQLAAPTKSWARWMQEVGRGTRALPGLVDLYFTAQERINAIAASGKPFCWVLDNAGLFREFENKFPDEEFDLKGYFAGWKRKKKSKIDEDQEFIEFLVYEIEDPITGARRRTSNIEEISGMILIEITKEYRERLRAIAHIKEFNKLYNQLLYGKKVASPGHVTLRRFIDHMDKIKIVIDDATFRHMREVLVERIEQDIVDYTRKLTASGLVVVPSMNQDIHRIKSRGVDGVYFDRERSKCKAAQRRGAQ